MAIDHAKFTKQYDALVERYEQTRGRQSEVIAKIDDRIFRQKKIERFIMNLEAMPELFTEFDENLWAVLMNGIMVYDNGWSVLHLTTGVDVEA